MHICRNQILFYYFVAYEELINSSFLAASDVLEEHLIWSMIWPDDRVSFIAVYYIAAWCGYFSQPALAAIAAQEPYDRFLKQRWTGGNGGGVAASLLKKFFIVEEFCDRKKDVLLMVSCASLVLTALAVRWTWWWFHGSKLSLFVALLSLMCVEFAGFLLGLGLHQWLLVLTRRGNGPNSNQATSQMESGTLRIVPSGESPPASPTTTGRRIV